MTKTLEAPKTKAVAKPKPETKAVAKPKVAEQKPTESMVALKGMMLKCRSQWEAALKDLLATPNADTQQKFYNAVGKDLLARMREHHTAYIKEKGNFFTPDHIIAQAPEDIQNLMYTTTWPTMKADELSVFAGKYLPEFAPLYRAYSIGGILRPISDSGRPSRPASSFIAAKVGYAIIRGF